MINFKLWIFDFDLSSLIAFLIGIFVGFALLAIIYAILVVSSLKSKKYVVEVQNNEVTDEEILLIIKNSQKAFKDKGLKGAQPTINYAIEVTLNMAKDISRKFFPKSKRPFAELSVDELLRLSVYISNRINDILDRPALRLLKKVKLSTILGLTDAKKVIDESSLMKMTKKYKVKKIFNTVKNALNLFNPVYWIRKGIIDTSLNFAIKKLCQAVIGIAGEETYKVYSKRVFNEEKLIDSGVLEIAHELDNDMEDVTEEEIDQYLANEALERRGE